MSKFVLINILLSDDMAEFFSNRCHTPYCSLPLVTKTLCLRQREGIGYAVAEGARESDRRWGEI
jgi:hypothetical protein